MIFTGLTVRFLKEFGVGLRVTMPLLLTLATAIAFFGQVVGKMEAGHDLTAFIGRSSRELLLGLGIFARPKGDQGLWAIFIALLMGLFESEQVL